MRTEDGYVIQQCLEGKSATFSFLVDKYKRSVYALAYSEVHNFHDAQDITQEVFIKAFQNLHTLRRWDSFMGWLCRITLNVSRNWVRSESRRLDSESFEAQGQSKLDYASVNFYKTDTLHDSVREALDTLPEVYSQVLTLRYFGGMTVREMANFLGISPRTIDRRIREGQARLKEEILTMIGTAKEQHELPAAFTFRIVEAVKRIKINPMPKATSLPWGLSLAMGIIITIMSLNPRLSITNDFAIPRGFPLPVESKLLKIGEIPVDVMKIDKITTISSNQGDGNSGKIPPPNPQDKINSSFMSPAKEGQWTRKADMPTPRVDLRTGVVNGIIYAIGGSRNGTMLQTVEAYDPKTDTWTQKADMPTPRQGMSISVVDGIIYVIGGWNHAYLSTVETYNPATDTWTKKANMPTAKDWQSASVVDGIIYVIGGWDESVHSAVEAYDPVADTWTEKTDMLIPKMLHSSCVVNGIIYIIGGSQDANNDDITVQAYDIKNDIWIKKGNIPTPIYNFSASVINNTIYAIGFTGIIVYDLATDTWIEKNIRTLIARGWFSTSVTNGKIYTIGGGMDWNVALNEGVVEEYDTGFFSVEKAGKLPKTWGETKSR